MKDIEGAEQLIGLREAAATGKELKVSTHAVSWLSAAQPLAATGKELKET